MLGSLITRWALFTERSDAFGEVRARSHRVAEFLFERLTRQRMIGNRGADLSLDRLHRRGTVCGDHLGGLNRPAHQLVASHEPVYQTEPPSLLGIDQSRCQQ